MLRKNLKLKSGFGGLVVAALALVAWNSWTICSVGSECTATSFGTVVKENMVGFNLVPFWYNIDEYDIKDNTWTFDNMGVPSQDNFKTGMDVSFTGHFEEGANGHIRRTVGNENRYLNTHVKKQMRSCVIGAGGTVELSQEFFKDVVQRAMSDAAIACINKYQESKDVANAGVPNFVVTAVQFADINLATTVKKMIIGTKERQEKEKHAASALEIADKKAQEKTKVSAAVKLAAVDYKAAAISKAEGLKEAAELEAEGNKKLAASVTPALVQYVRAKAWNGQYPTHMLGDNTAMFLK